MWSCVSRRWTLSGKDSVKSRTVGGCGSFFTPGSSCKPTRFPKVGLAYGEGQGETHALFVFCGVDAAVLARLADFIIFGAIIPLQPCIGVDAVVLARLADLIIVGAVAVGNLPKCIVALVDLHDASCGDVTGRGPQPPDWDVHGVADSRLGSSGRITLTP